MTAMTLWDVPPLDVRGVLIQERQHLLRLLASLTTDEWHTPTDVPGWTVKDLALHILDDDLGWLSRGRDEDPSGRLDDNEATFVEALARKNQRWVDGAVGLSRRVVTDLLSWSGEQMDGYYASMDLLGEGHVGWASSDPVPIWFDIAQDLTERWVHQMQMRVALDRVENYRDSFLPMVLRTFVWAIPRQLIAPTSPESGIAIDLSSGGVWTLTSSAGGWDLDEGDNVTVGTRAWFSDDAGWRWLTGASIPEGGMTFEGDDELVASLLAVRGILA